MKSRRDFLKVSAAATAAVAARPLFAWQGANNRVAVKMIGGHRQSLHIRQLVVATELKVPTAFPLGAEKFAINCSEQPGLHLRTFAQLMTL